MGRGLISGVLWGSLIAVISLWLLSQISGMVGLLSDPPQDVAVVAPDVGEPVPGTGAGETPVAPDSQGPPATDPSRQGTGLTTANTDSPPSADTVPAQVPDASDVAAGQSNPEPEMAPVLESRVDALALPATVAIAPIAPVAPGGEAAPAAAALPPPLLAPLVTARAPENPIVVADPADPADPAGAVLVPDTSPPVASKPDQPENPVADAVPENDFSTPTVVATPAPVEPAPAPDAAVTVTDSETPAVLATPGVAVVVDRSRKSASETQATQADPAPENVAPDADGVEVAVTGPAIEIYAETFDNPAGRPLMAIVLLPPANGDPAFVPPTALPFPVTYVVDASKDSATALMRGFRDTGNEVAVLTPLPEGAAPRDVEVAFQAYFNAVPEAVAVMDVPDAVFQSGRNVATQVAAALEASGRGMVTYSRGLNSATQVAERAGVPAALVFRVFDKDGRDAAAIKRFLDQAAFRAGQQPGVILVGQNRAETITALLEWALGNRAGTVALAPLSAVLLDR